MLRLKVNNYFFQCAKVICSQQNISARGAMLPIGYSDDIVDIHLKGAKINSFASLFYAINQRKCWAT